VMLMYAYRLQYAPDAAPKCPIARPETKCREPTHKAEMEIHTQHVHLAEHTTDLTRPVP